jgi:hypothetical protein
MDVLPVWLQWAVSLATVLSSIGVIVALIQLKISGTQFKEQLKLTERQFKLTNQGYIQCTVNHEFYMSNGMAATQEDAINPATLFNSIFPVASLENVGNLPVLFFVAYFKVSFDGTEVYHTPEEILTRTENILYPKQNMPFLLGQFFFDEQHSNLSLEQVQALKITYNILVNYNDYNDKTQKTVNRELELSGVYVMSKGIKDSLPLLK